MAEPLVWLPLNGNSQNLGVFDSVVTNHEATTDLNGKIGQCYVTGNSKYITATCPDLSTSEWSICVWAYPKASSSDGHQYVVGMNTSSASDYTGVLCFYHDQFAVRIKSTTYTAGSVTLNTWHHMVATYDKSTLKLYVDGELIYTNTSPAVPVAATTCFIGTRGGLAGWFGGNINDVRIYDCCLSDKEVQDISKALVLHYPLDNNGGGNENLIKNSSLSNNLVDWSPSGTWDLVNKDGEWCYHHTGALQTTASLTPTYIINSNNAGFIPTNGLEITMSADVLLENVTKGTTNYYIALYGSGQTIDGTWRSPTTVSYSEGVPSGTLQPATFNGKGWKRVWVSYRYGNYNWSNYLRPNIYARDYTGDFYIKNVKIEYGVTHTEWSPCRLDYNDSNIVYDCSGYHNDGILNSIDFEASSPRYEGCSVLTASKYSYVKTTENKWMAQAAPELTINLWAYSDNWTSMGSARLFSCTESGGFNTEAGNSGYIRFPNYVYTTESLGSPAYRYSSNELKLSSLTTGWHMLTFIRNLSGNKVYVDSEFHSSTDFVNYGECFNLNARLFLGCEASGASPSSPYTNAKMSDFRIYYSELSAEDIKELYNVGASVDNKYNIHTHEYIEDNYSDNPSIYKSGIVKARSFVENFSEHTLKDLYDTVYYTEPDGSKWIRIFHHNNPASKLFSSTNDFIDRVYIDADRWFDISICNYVSRWELMVKQKTTSSATETKYRWIQFVNPMIGTFNETKAADVIKITTSGYTNVSNAGGIIQGSSENTYMTINNGTSGNWYGAIGCWTAYNSGIPGYPNSVVTSGYMDLYLRIDDSGIYKEFISGNELIEI